MTDRLDEIRALLAGATALPIARAYVHAFDNDGSKYLDVASDADLALTAAAPELLAWAVAEIERLRGVLVSAIDDLSEHVGDGCAGPRGTARRGACRDCALAEFLTRYLIVAPLGGLVSVDGQTIRSGDSGKGPTP